MEISALMYAAETVIDLINATGNYRDETYQINVILADVNRESYQWTYWQCPGGIPILSVKT